MQSAEIYRRLANAALAAAHRINGMEERAVMNQIAHGYAYLATHVEQRELAERTEALQARNPSEKPQNDIVRHTSK